jgi:hypothetical protein
MTLDEARAYLRSRPMDLKAKEVLELLERMEGEILTSRRITRSWFNDKDGKFIFLGGPINGAIIENDVIVGWHDIGFTHSRQE